MEHVGQLADDEKKCVVIRIAEESCAKSFSTQNNDEDHGITRSPLSSRVVKSFSHDILSEIRATIESEMTESSSLPSSVDIGENGKSFSLIENSSDSVVTTQSVSTKDSTRVSTLQSSGIALYEKFAKLHNGADGRSDGASSLMHNFYTAEDEEEQKLRQAKNNALRTKLQQRRHAIASTVNEQTTNSSRLDSDCTTSNNTIPELPQEFMSVGSLTTSDFAATSRDTDTSIPYGSSDTSFKMNSMSTSVSSNEVNVGIQRKRSNNGRGGNPPDEIWDTRDVNLSGKQTLPPYLMGHDLTSTRWKQLSPFQMLHEEICCLVKWLDPTPGELLARQEVIGRITVAVNNLWPDCKVQPFGSYYTGLWLPNGDLDICLIDPTLGNSKRPLEILASELCHYKVARGIEVIRHARVPIVKYVDHSSGIPVDISINQDSALETSVFVRKQLRNFVMLRPLIIVLKVFLQQRGLNETYKGGVGSYLLFVMTLHFLQLHPSSSNSELHAKVDLGMLLFEFFHYYCRLLHFQYRGISVHHGGYTYQKPEDASPTLLSAESPLDPSFDIGRNSWNIREVRGCFAQSFGDLLEKMSDLTRQANTASRMRSSCLPTTDDYCPMLSTVIYTNNPLFRLRKGVNDSHPPVGVVRNTPELPNEVFQRVTREMRGAVRNHRRRSIRRRRISNGRREFYEIDYKPFEELYGKAISSNSSSMCRTGGMDTTDTAAVRHNPGRDSKGQADTKRRKVAVYDDDSAMESSTSSQEMSVTEVSSKEAFTPTMSKVAQRPMNSVGIQNGKSSSQRDGIKQKEAAKQKSGVLIVDLTEPEIELWED